MPTFSSRFFTRWASITFSASYTTRMSPPKLPSCDEHSACLSPPRSTAMSAPAPPCYHERFPTPRADMSESRPPPSDPPRHDFHRPNVDRNSVVYGKLVSLRVESGGSRLPKKKHN